MTEPLDDTPPVGTIPVRAAPPPAPARTSPVATIVALVAIVAVAAVGFTTLKRISDLEERITSLAAGRESLTSLTARVGIMEQALGAGGQGAVDQSSAAVGSALGPISGTSWPSGEPVTVDPADGTVRLFLVAAHWCPYCGATLDALIPAWESIDLGRVEMVMISTAQDPTRGAPEEQYLAEADPPWPVVIDPALGPIAAQLGVTSFPTWVATDGAGVVVGRFGGMIDDVARFQGLIDQLQASTG
jgi:hypothetical protein